MRIPALILIAFRVGQDEDLLPRDTELFVDIFSQAFQENQDRLIGQVAIGVLEEFGETYDSLRHFNLSQFRTAFYEDLHWIEDALPNEQTIAYLSMMKRLFAELTKTSGGFLGIKARGSTSRNSAQLNSFLLDLIEDKLQACEGKQCSAT